VLADYFEELAVLVPNAKDASNWIMGPLLSLSAGRLDGGATTMISPASLAELIGFVSSGRISHASARKALGVMAAEGLSADVTIRRERLDQVTDVEQLKEWVDEVVGGNPKEVESYLEGNRRVLGFLMGRVMMRSGGRADPKEANRLLRQRLSREV
jgi:aspartyl-tRNA(Asn)/glutamyl-tRNA(Gln) amidotransferase subunit B